jgi:putative tricarboxylic transport membrane protein
MYIGNVMLLVLNLPLIPVWVRVLKIPYSYLSALIIVFCLIGAYSLNNNITDIIVLWFFGLVGFFAKKFEYEPAPFVLAFVLGPMIETALRRSLIMSDGSFSIFFQRPIAAVFLSITIVALAVPFFIKKRIGAGLASDE